MTAYIILFIAAVGFAYGASQHYANDAAWGRQLSIASLVLFAMAMIFVAGFVYTLIMTLAVVMTGSMYIAKKSQATWCRPVAVIAGMVGIFVAAAQMATTNYRTHEDVTIPEGESYYPFESCGEVLGKRIRSYIKTNVVVVTNSNLNPEMIRNFMAGLKNGINAPTVHVIRESIPVQDPDVPTSTTSANDTDAPVLSVIKKHRNSDLIISLVPMTAELVGFLLGEPATNDKSPRYRICHVGAPPPRLDDLIRSQLVVAAVLDNPEPRIYEPEMTTFESPTQVFDRDYIIIQGDNLEQMKLKYPILFY